ncbi:MULTISPECIES: choline-binding transcriptional repressor BetI [Sulfitobacter]|jgi:TetR/AcrR family transcriptional repressor of bet genes|uniref:HTH-type transcriptional regulator BetI n=2 Tax=root TaxID=1 RepID=A0A1H0R306_9RHOB|nr:MULTISPECIES: transcriptional regulator BetI [Sulfitobacter]MBQ0716790.1 transcriptional regulator BetI [Sulfitobacter litoralis]MBQ0765931.1 transcriptional regulator BetI [Sulfitobacter litoralis]MBQ0801969.1 transcriptional regulator BetI [Sulfitobacter litoralis]MCF7726487.1 transcriptional regulator BetI [Sulfitobacter sp. M22]MCF7777829.1 transcriptional regulator BetI [Sulfitobacter sp. M220]
MPKVGMEPIRRDALVKATIAEIGAAQSLDVTVGQIARRAGMSSALAHHYFGGKDQIFLAAMRYILSEYSAEVRRELRLTKSPLGRAEAIIRASFEESYFDPATVSAWMTLYASSRTNTETYRLLVVYQRRLRSNLTYALRPISDDPSGDADTLAALIDGLYLRAALSDDGNARTASDRALSVLHMLVGTAV